MYLLPSFLCYTFVTMIILSCHGHTIQALEKVFYDINNAETLFEDFIKKYNKNYDEKEYKIRFEIFVNKLKLLNERNQRDTAVHAINKFADLSQEEFQSKYLGFRMDTANVQPYNGEIDYTKDVPEEIDYRKQNKVTPVKNQEGCASCWAFGSIAIIETQYALKYDQLHSLSEQQLVDCSTGCAKCRGCYEQGIPSIFENIIQKGGVQNETTYQYSGANGTCHFDKNLAVANIKSFSYGKLDEEAMKVIVGTHGPLAVGVNADGFDYTNTTAGGVLQPTKEQCPEDGAPNHLVAIMGYGTDENGLDYWLIKNSWGTDVGEDGYIRFIRGKAACAITEFVISVDV